MLQGAKCLSKFAWLIVHVEGIGWGGGGGGGKIVCGKWKFRSSVLFIYLFIFILRICSTNVTSAPECVVYLTSKCKKLRKLFLTALR